MSDCCEVPVDEYDLVVIGSGGAGMAAALEARDRGARTLMIEAGVLGGTCVNVGCVPSKFLVRAGMAAESVRRPVMTGISGSEPALDTTALLASRSMLVETLREEKYAGVLDRAGVELLRGTAHFLAPHVLSVNGATLRGKQIVLATGTRAAIPTIPGLREAKPWTNVELLTAERLPGRLVVLGGGYVAVEAAQSLARLGTRVTLLQRSDRILRHEDPEASRIVTQSLERDGVKVVTNATLLSASRDAEGTEVRYKDGAGQATSVRADEILAALGRVANVERLDLPAAGIEVNERGFPRVNDELETTAPGHFGAGDLIGPPSFVYTAAFEGRLAARNALAEAREERSGAPVPHVVFTDPQVAQVGPTASALERGGVAFDRAHISLSDVPRFLVSGETEGFVQLLRDPASDKVLGATIVAPEAGDLIMLPTLAMQHDITVGGLVDTLHPYLTGAESIRLAARTFETSPKMLSCCA